jgi:hypothetical protein
MGPLSWLVSATPCKERHVLYDAFTHLQLHFVPPTNFFRRCFVIHGGTKECGVSDIIQWKNMEMLGSYLGTFWKLTKLWCLWNVAWYYINLVSPCHPTYPACMGSQLYRDINGVSNITSPGFSKSLQHVFDQLTRCLPRPRYGSCYSRCWRFFIGASPQEVLQGLAAIIGPGSTVATGIVGKAGWHAINGHNIPLLTYIDIYWSDWLGGINPSIFQPASGTKGPLGIDAPPRGSSSGASFDFGRTTFYALPIPTSLWKPSTYHIQKSREVNIGHALTQGIRWVCLHSTVFTSHNPKSIP